MSEQPASEQPNSAEHEAPGEPGQDTVAEDESFAHGRVRTEGEISVDDALGGTDDPR